MNHPTIPAALAALALGLGAAGCGEDGEAAGTDTATTTTATTPAEVPEGVAAQYQQIEEEVEAEGGETQVGPWRIAYIVEPAEGWFEPRGGQLRWRPPAAGETHHIEILPTRRTPAAWYGTSRSRSRSSTGPGAASPASGSASTTPSSSTTRRTSRSPRPVTTRCGPRSRRPRFRATARRRKAPRCRRAPVPSSRASTSSPSWNERFPAALRRARAERRCPIRSPAARAGRRVPPGRLGRRAGPARRAVAAAVRSQRAGGTRRRPAHRHHPLGGGRPAALQRWHRCALPRSRPAPSPGPPGAARRRLCRGGAPGRRIALRPLVTTGVVRGSRRRSRGRGTRPRADLGRRALARPPSAAPTLPPRTRVWRSSSWSRRTTGWWAASIARRRTPAGGPRIRLHTLRSMKRRLRSSATRLGSSSCWKERSSSASVLRASARLRTR